MKINDTNEWKALQAHYKELASSHLQDLFAADPWRAAAFSLNVDGLLLDYSKNRITADTIGLLVALSEKAGVPDAIEQMFDRVNSITHHTA